MSNTEERPPPVQIAKEYRRPEHAMVQAPLYLRWDLRVPKTAADLIEALRSNNATNAFVCCHGWDKDRAVALARHTSFVVGFAVLPCGVRLLMMTQVLYNRTLSEFEYDPSILGKLFRGHCRRFDDYVDAEPDRQMNRWL